MQFKNTTTTYGIVSKSFHWIMAVLVIGIICLGLYMGGATPLLHKLRMYDLHKSLGITILILVTARVLFHLYSKPPELVDGMRLWERWAAKGMHYALYLAMFAMPLSGWLMSSAGGRPVKFFGLFTLPDLVGQDDGLRNVFAAAHAVIVYLLIAAILAHAGAALKHHFIKKDNTFKRMLPIVAALLLLPTPAAAVPVAWDIVKSDSTLTFTGKQMNKEFSGKFNNFDVDIYFDTEDPAGSHVKATIYLDSIDTADKDRDHNVKGADWFDIKNHPHAVFETADIKKTGDGAYTAAGTLNLRGVAVAITLDFTLTTTLRPDGKTEARMTGNATLDRRAFGLGGGEWADESVIANDFDVAVQLVAVAR